MSNLVIGPLPPGTDAEVESLRCWARRSWVIVFSHPGHYGDAEPAASDLARLRDEFTRQDVRPLALARNGRKPEKSWIHAVNDDDALVVAAVAGRAAADPDRRIVDLDQHILNSLMQDGENQRFVLLLDGHIRLRSMIRYRLGTSRDPGEALRLVGLLRARAEDRSVDGQSVAGTRYRVQESW